MKRMLTAALPVLTGLILSCATEGEKLMQNDLPDFDSAWNFGDPAATREIFTSMLREEGDRAPRDWGLELETQIARTHSLVAEFDEAHALLDGVERELTDGDDRVRVRYLLERGRCFNSAGEKAHAKPLFVEAWEIGRRAGEDRLAIDAAHMVALAAPGTDEAQEWNLKGLELARESRDASARNWVGSLTYNMGWEAFEGGEPSDALALFEESRLHFEERGAVDQERISRWSVARALRELGRNDEAMGIQLALRQEHADAGTEDGFVHEELGELFLAAGDERRAHEQFAIALPLLEKIRWFVNEEPERLARVRKLAE